jgi:adenylate kinase family enzyme
MALATIFATPQLPLFQTSTNNETAILVKTSDVILAGVFEKTDACKDCPLCLRPFGRTLANGKQSKVMVACAPQREVRIGKGREHACLVCDECVGDDGEGHIGNKGKCRSCLKAGWSHKQAFFALTTAVEVSQASKVFAAIDQARDEEQVRANLVEESGQDQAMQAGIDARKAALQAKAISEGFRSRNEQLEARRQMMQRATDSDGWTGGTDPTKFSEFTLWQTERQVQRADESAEQARARAETEEEALANIRRQRQHEEERLAALQAENEEKGTQAGKKRSRISEEKKEIYARKAKERAQEKKDAFVDLDVLTDGRVSKERDLGELVNFVRELMDTNIFLKSQVDCLMEKVLVDVEKKHNVDVDELLVQHQFPMEIESNTHHMESID